MRGDDAGFFAATAAGPPAAARQPCPTLRHTMADVVGFPLHQPTPREQPHA